MFTTSADIKRTPYFMVGGPPARHRAWKDPTIDALSGSFFRDTLGTHDRAIVRPRYSGWVPLRHSCGGTLQRCLRDGADQANTPDELDRLDRASRSGSATPAT